jgi:1,4-dihydroxy-2-naphthoate octaprenyltransferase
MEAIQLGREGALNSLKVWLGPARTDFLYMDAACVLLGAGAALWTHGAINVWHVIVAFVGALAAHVSVNALNEYFDFRSGLDLGIDRTPFSGGSGTLRERPDLARWALGLGLGALALAGLIGVYFLIASGWGLLPLGLVGVVTIVVYTPWITRLPAVSLIVTGLGFGLLMTNGVYYVLTGEYNWTSFFASLIPFFLGNCLLLLNQYPDVEADKAVGRRNYPILMGRRASSGLFWALMAGAYLSLLAGVGLGHLPPLALLGLGTLPLGIVTASGVRKWADDLPHLLRYMGYNVLVMLITPAAVGVGLLVAAALR